MRFWAAVWRMLAGAAVDSPLSHRKMLCTIAELGEVRQGDLVTATARGSALALVRWGLIRSRVRSGRQVLVVTVRGQIALRAWQ